jgi:fermentation-respiration switch protein FrsA (DUF1100 family)
MVTAPPIVLILLVLVVTLYLVCAPRFNTFLYRPLLFHPWRLADEPVAPPLCGIAGENVYFPSANGKLLNGWFYNNPNAKYTILFSHGNGGNVSVRTDLVQLLLQSGASVLIYDYEGYGESVGLPSVEGICQDGVGAYKFLTNIRAVPANTIVFYGESLGAGVSAYLTTKFECKALILQSGFASLKRIACEIFPLLQIYPDWLYPAPSLDTASILANKHPPLLVLHGAKDILIPYAHAQFLFDHAVGPKKLVALPETGHANIFSSAPQAYTAEIKSFLTSLT